MKKIFTPVVMAVMCLAAIAQNGVVELSWDTMLKNETKDDTADQAAIKFLNADSVETGFILKPAGGRTQTQTIREECGKVLNFKNNTNQELVIPEGTKMYKINFYGWSQGDNWSYLYAYGPTVTEWEWTDSIGTGIQDNTVIIDQAKYPMDPCVAVEANVKESASAPGTYETTCYHNAGYCFASIDFSDEPYEGSFCFVFNGNNQERAWMEIYTTREAAAAAPAAEAPRLGKDKSQKNFITGIHTPTVARQINDDVMYNLNGQRVDESYRGIYIQNGQLHFAR